MRRQRHRSAEKGDQSLGNGGCLTAQRSHRNQRAPNRPNERVNGVPHRIDPRDFVGDELDKKQRQGGNDNGWVFERTELSGEGEQIEACAQAEGGDRCVQIETSGGSQRYRVADDRQRTHTVSVTERRLKCQKRSNPLFHSTRKSQTLTDVPAEHPERRRSIQNRVLRSLSPQEYERLTPH